MDFHDLGTIEYESALDAQLNHLKVVQEDPKQAKVFLCTHPSVVTLGRSTQPSDVMGWAGKTIEISRGGRATYHGPGQLVVYPIVNLKDPIPPIPKMDLHKYMRFLEETVIRALDHYDVKAEARESTQYDERGKKILLTGVWVGDKKIASLGIGVKRWTAYHGVAININSDPEAFTGINPCGFSKETMTCLSELVNEPIDRDQFAKIYSKSFFPVSDF